MRADRLISMMMLLQTRGKMTANVLANELEVSRRTILRDVEALSIAGIPIYTDGGHGGGITLDENYRTKLTGLNEAEIQTLFLAGNNQLLKEVGLGEAADRTLRKLFASLPARHQPSVDYIRQRIYIDPVWWWHDAKPLPFWSELQDAVYQDRCIQAVYENYEGEVAERLLEPYSLVSKSSSWYLIAKSKGKLRTFRISRFHQIVLLDTTFHRDKTFELISYWHEHLNKFASAFSEYKFSLRIHPDRVNFVRWLTPGRYIEEGVDDAGWVTMHFQIDSKHLAQMLVFGLGTQCEVIKPLTLKEEVLYACRAILDS